MVLPRLFLGCWALALTVACTSKPPESERRPRTTSVDGQVKAQVKKAIDEFAKTLEGQYAPKNEFNLANSLRGDVLRLEGDISALEKSIGLGLGSKESADALLQPLRQSLAELDERVQKVEQDLNSTLDDVFQMRGEVRNVLQTLESYREVSRAVLEVQRESLTKQLETLDEVLEKGLQGNEVGASQSE